MKNIEKLRSLSHHIEFIDMPELKPMELYGLMKLARYLEPYTNRIVMMCELNITSGGKVINKVIKPLGIKAGDIKEIVGCSPRAANMLAKSLMEKNIMRRDKDYYLNPRHVRAYDSLSTEGTAALFEKSAEVSKTSEDDMSTEEVDKQFEEEEKAI